MIHAYEPLTLFCNVTKQASFRSCPLGKKSKLIHKCFNSSYKSKDKLITFVIFHLISRGYLNLLHAKLPFIKKYKNQILIKIQSDITPVLFKKLLLRISHLKHCTFLSLSLSLSLSHSLTHSLFHSKQNISKIRLLVQDESGQEREQNNTLMNLP